MGNVICKDAVEMHYHLYCVCGQLFIIWAQPDQYLRSILVYKVHQFNLLAALCYVVLVDANLVCPQPARRVRQSYADQRIVDTLRDTEGGRTAV